MLLGIYYARTEGKAGNRREVKGRAGQGKGWKGGEEGQHKQKNSTIAWRLYENDFGPEEQHVIRVRRDAKVAALAGTRQNKNQQQTGHFPLASRGFHFFRRIHKLNKPGREE